MPQISKAYLNYGIVRSAGLGADRELLLNLAWFIPKGEVPVTAIGADGLPTGEEYVAVHEDGIIGWRRVGSEAERKDILCPQAIAPDREAEAEAKLRVEGG